LTVCPDQLYEPERAETLLAAFRVAATPEKEYEAASAAITYFFLKDASVPVNV
jgi:hypothetical protein